MTANDWLCTSVWIRRATGEAPLQAVFFIGIARSCLRLDSDWNSVRKDQQRIVCRKLGPQCPAYDRVCRLTSSRSFSFLFVSILSSWKPPKTTNFPYYRRKIASTHKITGIHWQALRAKMTIVRKMMGPKPLGQQIAGRSACNRQPVGLSVFLVIVIIECVLLQPVVSDINHNEFLAQLKVPQCRKDCLDKVRFIAIVTSQSAVFLHSLPDWSCVGPGFVAIIRFAYDCTGLSSQIVRAIKVFPPVSMSRTIYCFVQLYLYNCIAISENVPAKTERARNKQWKKSIKPSYQYQIQARILSFLPSCCFRPSGFCESAATFFAADLYVCRALSTVCLFTSFILSLFCVACFCYG